MKYRFITALYNMRLDSIKNKGMKIFPGARISNGAIVLEETLKTKIMKSTLGVHSIREFENTTYVYIDGEFEDISTTEEMDEIGVKYTFFYLREIQSFIQNLWEVKDNNVYVRDGFLLAYTNRFEDGLTYKASLSEIFSYSNRSQEDSIFSDSELIEAILNFVPYTIEEYREDGGKHPESDHLFRSKGSERIQRARYFTLMARSSAILPMKILSYCTALECLFTIGTAEINHKIAERVAILLGTSDESKKLLYKTIKEAYNYRSKIVHGQYIKGTEEDLVTISKELDDILRKLIVGKHEIFSKKDLEIEDFFLDLLFS